MLVQLDFKTCKPEWASSIVCIGTFDGFHLGHQAVVLKAIELAKRADLPVGLITFDRNPLAVLAPKRAPKKVASWQKTIQLADEMGASFALVLKFTPELSQMTAQDFLDLVIKNGCHASEVVVGQDFALGHKRQGTAEWLSNKIRTSIVNPIEINGIRVSSTQIRGKIAEGDIAGANQSLGRPFSLNGIVVGGEKVGRTLGFPTANLAQFDDQIVPSDGVYGGFANTVFGKFRAAISIGNRPSIGDRSRAVEGYLIDYSGKNLYGTEIEFGFLTKIRNQERFESIDELKLQMTKDVEALRSEMKWM